MSKWFDKEPNGHYRNLVFEGVLHFHLHKLASPINPRDLKILQGAIIARRTMDTKCHKMELWIFTTYGSQIVAFGLPRDIREQYCMVDSPMSSL